MKLSLLIILVSLPIWWWSCCKAYPSTATSLPSSSCGHITITCPFRLKGDNRKCGEFRYELSCHNNSTLLLEFKTLDNIHFSYYVEDIDYHNRTIRVVGRGLNKYKQSCSSDLSLHSLPLISYKYIMTKVREVNTPITFIDCSAPANSTRYIRAAASCSLSSSIRNDSYSYIVIGDLDWSEVEESCSLIMETIWISSRSLPSMAVTSFQDIIDHANGFEIPWPYLSCLNCEADRGICVGDHGCYHPRRLTIRLFFAWTGVWALLIWMARFLCGIPFLLALIVYKSRRRHLSVYNTIEDFLQAQTNLMPIRYNYSQIKKMTNNFKDKLGEGGFGAVYKGKLKTGPLVAVKMLGKSTRSGQEFVSEVATIGRIHHANVVKLLGFCFEGSKRALIYEFMPNGSLEKYIFPREEDTRNSTTLSCEKMYEISFKVATGIEYLHRGCAMQILHFDIKPHNILLDENFSPKISDFGLAKLYSTEDSIVTLTAARGTMGYMAPELFYKNIGGVSYKADVYSFGMLLMEMAGRRKNLNPFVENVSQIYFPSWIYDQFSQGKEIEIEDASDEERRLVKKMVIVALWCIQMKPTDRPSMSKVMEMLEGDVENLVMPPKPFLCPQEGAVED